MLYTVVTLEFEQAEYTVNEDEITINYCVLLNGTIDLIVRADIGLRAGGSAQPDTDFQFSPTSHTFQPSVNSQNSMRMCQTVTVSEDNIVEPVENFFLTLSSNTSESVIIAVAETEITILDSTHGPINYLNSSIVVDEGDTVSLCFSNTLILERNITVQIHFDAFGSE